MRNARQACTLTAIAALVVGCVATQPLQPDRLVTQARVMTSTFVKTGQPMQSIDMSKLRSFGNIGKVTEMAGYRQEFGWWCRDEGTPDSWKVTRDAFGEICRRQGGEYRDNFCSSAADRERVLFMAKVTRHDDLCAQVEALVLMPTTSPDSPDYVGRLRQEGFLTNADLRARQATDMQRRKAEAALIEQGLARAAAELPQMRRRGASICRQERGITYIAFVEDYTDERLRVLITHAYATSSPTTSVGFQQRVDWVRPEDWYLCNVTPGR